MADFDLDVEALTESYDREGYAIIRGVFKPEEVSEMKERFDCWRSDMIKRHASTYVYGNTRVWIGDVQDSSSENGTRRILRGVQWPSYTDEVLDKYRKDDRIFAIASALLKTKSIKQIINQMHWKQPGSLTQWRYHQDVRSRKPDHCFRDLFSSYINMGISVEPCTDETGAMKVIPRTHEAKKDLGIEAIATELGVDVIPPTEETLHELLTRVGADPTKLKTLELEPGDVGVWNPFVIHGGGLNTSKDCYRSFYIQGFASAANCDRGHLVWEDGIPQPLGEQVHIQLDNYKETIAEGGRYYPFAGNKNDQITSAVAKSMNTVRD